MENTTDKERLIFISYGGSIDSDIADKLCEYLQYYVRHRDAVYCSAPINNENGTPYGDDFSKCYMANIEKAKVFIPLLSENYMASYTALIEMGAAFALKKKIIPFMVSGCNYNDLYPLYNIRNRDMKSLDDIDGFRKALHEIANELGEVLNVDENKTQDFIANIKKLKTDYKTNMYKQKQVVFSCERAFETDEIYNQFIKELEKRRVVDINIVTYQNKKIVKCKFFFKEDKNVRDLIVALKEMNYQESEYELQPIKREA